MRMMAIASIGLAVSLGADATEARAREASGQDCAARVSFHCLKSFGAGSTPVAGSDCDAQLRAYRACLSAAAATAPAPERNRFSCDPETARDLWSDAKSDNDCIGYQAFIEACPGAPQARYATARIERLGCDAAAAAAAASAVDRAQDAPAEISARHLLVETEAEARAIRVELMRSPSESAFARAAERYSIGPSAKTGGALGRFGRGMMVKPFEEAVFALAVGEISQPIQTQFGWHLAMRTE